MESGYCLKSAVQTPPGGWFTPSVRLLREPVGFHHRRISISSLGFVGVDFAVIGCVKRSMLNVGSFWRHAPASPPFISRSSQARAEAQLRFTVAGETPKNFDVSSIESPPK